MRSSPPVRYSAGCVSAAEHAGQVESVGAFAGPRRSSRAPDFTVNASRVSGGSWSHTSPKLYGPLIAATARTRGSNAAARGA